MKTNSNVRASRVFNLLFVIILGLVALYKGYFGFYLVAGICIALYRNRNSEDSKIRTAKAVREISAGFAHGKKNRKVTRNSVLFYEEETKATIDTWTLPLYLVYVGEHKSNLPHLVDPSLRIGTANADLKASMGYWPSYQDITENDRSTYLSWLAGGRNDPRADIGLVFLYFYGLEARALDERKDHWKILVELTRLYKIYSGHGSFSRYCRDLMIWLIHENQSWTTRELLAQFNFLILSQAITIRHFQPVFMRIFGDLADAELLCVVSSIHLNLTLPKGSSQFQDASKKMYLERLAKYSFNKLELEKKPSIIVKYSSASSLRYSVTAKGPYYKPSDKLLSDLTIAWDDVKKEISSFNKLAKAGSIFADLVDPQKSTIESNSSLKALKNFLVFDEHKKVTMAEVIKCIGKTPEDVTNTNATILMETVKKFGIAIEPDPDVSGKGFKESDSIIFFRGEPITSDLSKWIAVINLFDLAISIALADGEADKATINHIVNYISTHFKLSKEDEKRLKKRAIVLEDSKLVSSTIAKRIAATASVAQANVIAKFLFSVVALDGKLKPNESKALQRVFSIFELPAERFDKLVSDYTSGTKEELVVLKEASTSKGKKGVKINQPKPNAKELELDPTAVNNAFAEAEEVAKIMASVFADDESEVISINEREQAIHPSTTISLSEVERNVLETVLTQKVWLISEVETHCKKAGLMYGAFLIKINEYYEFTKEMTLLEEDGEELLVLLQTTNAGEEIA